MAGEDTDLLTLLDVEHRLRSGRLDMVTCDVFDTLVWRPVAHPVDLFPRLRDELVAAGLLAERVDHTTFRHARVGAEQRARECAWQERGTHECTIEEIYRELWEAFPPRLTGTRDAVARGVMCELAVEREALRPHAEVSALIALARECRVPVELVSNTYFSDMQLAELLSAVGVDLDEIAVATSSSRGCEKAKGLLREVVDRSRVDPSRIVHIGDDEEADVEAAAMLGMAVLHVGFGRHAKPWSTIAPYWRDLSLSSGTDHGVTAAQRACVVAAGPSGRSQSFQFGAIVAGPLLAGFAGWVGATAEQLGATHIHCLLREGATIAELIRRVRPVSPAPTLVHASRWVYARAAVIDGTAAELERALARRQRLDAEHVAAAFGVPVDDVRSVIGTAGVAHHDQLEAFAAIADSPIRERIVASAADIRSRLLSYLDDTLRLGDGPLVLSDIGWGGSIQTCLESILAAERQPVEAVGLYAMLSTTGERRVGEGVRMLSYVPSPGDPDGRWNAAVVARHPEFLERIATPGIGTLVDIGVDGAPQTAPPERRSASLLAAQRGAAEFARSISEQSAPSAIDAWVGDRAAAVASQRALASVLLDPARELAEEIGDWEHDDVAGVGHERLVGNSLPRWVRYMSGTDAARVPMWEAYWVAGAAALASPAVGAELRATTRNLLDDSDLPAAASGRGLLAAFAPHDLEAAVQSRSTGRLAPGGWSLIAVDGATDGLRCLRFDPSETGCIGEVADAEIELVLADHSVRSWQGAQALRRWGTWLGGRWIDDSRFECSTGGYLLVVPPSASDVRAVHCTIAWRTWAGVLPASWSHRVRSSLHATKRRLGRLAGRDRTR